MVTLTELRQGIFTYLAKVYVNFQLQLYITIYVSEHFFVNVDATMIKDNHECIVNVRERVREDAFFEKICL